MKATSPWAVLDLMTRFPPACPWRCHGGSDHGAEEIRLFEDKRGFWKAQRAGQHVACRVKRSIWAIVLPMPSKPMTMPGVSPWLGAVFEKDRSYQLHSTGLQLDYEYKIPIFWCLPKKQMGLNTDAKQHSSEGHQRNQSFQT